MLLSLRKLKSIFRLRGDSMTLLSLLRLFLLRLGIGAMFLHVVVAVVLFLLS